jgi:AraC-like DNA-binding protein
VNLDPLSDVLRTVRLKGAIFFDVHTANPWVAEAPPVKVIAPAVMPDAEHVIEYHVLTSGSCWASMIGRDSEPIGLTAGDVVAFPRGDAHVLSSAPGMRAAPASNGLALPESATHLPILLNLDGGGSGGAHVVCGFLGCDSRPFNPLLDSLPPILHVRGSATARSGWAQQFTRFALLEAQEKRAGANGMLAKLGELMFVEIVRHHVETLPDGSRGWLAGLRDRHVGRALNLLHERPTAQWTLDRLARDVGLSRSSFADRFTAFVGVPPMQYLQRWRMQIAASRLAEGTAGIATIAAEIGYDSEAAFSRAFKKIVGMPPARWRSKRLPSSGPL